MIEGRVFQAEQIHAARYSLHYRRHQLPQDVHAPSGRPKDGASCPALPPLALLSLMAMATQSESGVPHRVQPDAARPMTGPAPAEQLRNRQ